MAPPAPRRPGAQLLPDRRGRRTGCRKLTLPVRNEETGAVEAVSKFGVRVPEATFETIARDKRDDGIVQKNRFAVKRRGMLTAEYAMPFEGGFITKW